MEEPVISDDEVPDAKPKGGFAMPDFVSAIRQVATSSVMSPLQWILGIVAAAATFGMIFAPDPWVRGGCLVIFAGSLLYVLNAYHHFRKRDPNRLQSEKFNYAQAKLKQEGKLLLDERNRGSKLILNAAPVANTHPVQYTTEIAQGEDRDDAR